MKAISVRVSGRVQGVYFRASTLEKAIALGVKGWCKNESDGAVLIHAEGEALALTELVSWCHKGPTMASVKNVVVSEASVEGFSDFSIRR